MKSCKGYQIRLVLVENIWGLHLGKRTIRISSSFVPTLIRLKSKSPADPNIPGTEPWPNLELFII